MKPDEKRKLDRLLCGGPGPSVQEKEAMLREILARSVSVSEEKRPVQFLRWMWAPAAAAVGAAVVVAVLVLHPVKEVSMDEEFTARGGAPATGSIRLSCTRSGQSQIPSARIPRCLQGETLVFRLDPPSASRFFSAAALGPEGLLVWYFPSEKQSSLSFDEEPVATRGVVIGPEHKPGDYQVFALFSEGPVSQNDLRAAIEAQASGMPGSNPMIVAHFTVKAP